MRKYYKVTTYASSDSITITKDGYYTVELIGGGGGSAIRSTDGNYGRGSVSCSGATGAYFKGVLNLSIGDVLSFTIGNGGNSKKQTTYTADVSGTVGEESILSINGSVFINAPGGNGAFISGGGNSGVADASPVTINYVVIGNKLINTITNIGVAGTYRYSSTTLNANSTIQSISPITSTVDGYGAGGGYIYRGNTATNGVGGALRLTLQVSATDDYDYYIDDYSLNSFIYDNKIYLPIKESTDMASETTYEDIGTYTTPKEMTLNLDVGYYLIEAISGGGSGTRCDGGSDPYTDTAWAHHYYANGGTGAYFKGVLQLPGGNIQIILGEQNKNRGDTGGQVKIGNGFTLSGGDNANVAGSSWKVTRSGGKLVTNSFVFKTFTYNEGVDGTNYGGFKDQWSRSYSDIGAPVPNNLTDYGYGGGVTSGTGNNGGNAYLKITKITSDLAFTKIYKVFSFVNPSTE